MRNVNTSLAIVLAALLTVAPLGFPEAESSDVKHCDGISLVEGIDNCEPYPGTDSQSADGGSNNGQNKVSN